MIIYRLESLEAEIILDVIDPDEPAPVQFRIGGEIVDGDSFDSLKPLKEALLEGWYGIFGHWQTLTATTAVDLDYGIKTMPIFKPINPVLIEGQEILDAFSPDPDVIY